MTPCVSVIMPVFNCERYISEAIESILTQTLDDFELILINDGSTDDTGIIAHSFRDPRIRFFENNHNQGLVATLNMGLELARSEIVARMDGDDVSMPIRLEEQYRFMHEHPEIGIAGCAVQIIDQDGRPIRIWRFPTDPALIRWILIFTNPTAHSSVMMRKSLVQGVGGYHDYLAEDIDLWERLTQLTQLTNLPFVLLKLRMHNSNKSNLERDALINSHVEISERIIQKYIGQGIPSSLIAKSFGERFDNPDDSLELARLIEKLFVIYVKSPGLLQTTQRSIRRDAARRILRLATKENIHLNQDWQLLKSACVLDPLVLARAFVSRATTLIAPANPLIR
jgi:glycosyltransferase involved in cell wall biosynthesis